MLAKKGGAMWKRTGEAMWKKLKKFRFRNRRGQGLTEYALLIALVSLGLILALGRFRNTLGNVFRNSTNTLKNNAAVIQAPVTGGGGGGGGGGGDGGGNDNGGNDRGGNDRGGNDRGR
jgi:Flp pilus assembly pilin Flp